MKIILTGGGTAGHVTPNISLLDDLQREGFDEIHYIGSIDGIEKSMIAEYPFVHYHGISSGKLRRYISVENLKDPFKVLKGMKEAKKLIKRINPDVVFSKGGFVSVPVVWAANKCKIPVVSHESDITPGLANRIAKRYVDKVCLNFPDTLIYIPEPKGIYTGTPIRDVLFTGNADNAKEMLGFDSKPVILVMGGSLGARALNIQIRSSLNELLKTYNIVHLCGKDNIDSSLEGIQGYKQYEFISKELPDIMALAHIIVSRAGANAIHEFLALKKPMLLIPLPLSQSRGDQILNAKSFESRGIAHVIDEEKLNDESFLRAITELENDRDNIIRKMSEDNISDGTQNVMNVILSVLKKNS